jgi:hypothetical protein
MFNILPVTISIAVAGLTHDSDVVSIPEGLRVIGWEFTTPDYTNAVTTTLSVLSATGRSMVSGSAINEATASVKLCSESEAPPIFSGFKLRATVSGATGGATAYTMVVLLYVQTGDDKALLIPSGVVTSMSFEHKDAALLDQATPVQNTWYTVLDTVHNVKVFGIAAGIADTGETIEVRVTVDGGTVTGSQAAVAGTSYRVHPYLLMTGLTLTFSSSVLINSNMCEARSFKVEARKTTANGTGNLKASVCYEQRG